MRINLAMSNTKRRWCDISCLSDKTDVHSVFCKVGTYAHLAVTRSRELLRGQLHHFAEKHP